MLSGIISLFDGQPQHMLFFLSGTSIRRVNEYVDTHYSIKSIFGG